MKKNVLILISIFISTGVLFSTEYQIDTSSVFKIISMPEPAISGTSTVCSGQSYSYQSNSDNTVEYKWEINGGTIIGDNNKQTVTVRWSNTTSGILKLIHIKSPSGCNDSTTMNITINPSPAPKITSGSSYVCAGSQSIYVGSSVSGITNKWFVTGGTINNSDDSSAIFVTWGNGSNGKVEFIQTNSTTGCKDSVELNVIVNPLPIPKINYSNLSVCAENIYKYKYTTTTDILNQWSVSGATIIGSADGNEIEVLWGNGSNGWVKLIQTNQTTGCKDSIIQNFTINPTPKKPVIKDTIIEFGGTANLTPSAPANCTFRWFSSIDLETPFTTKNTLIIENLKNDTSFYVESLNLTTSCVSKEKSLVKITTVPENAFLLNMKSLQENICKGDSALIGLISEMEQGTPPYNYDWQPTAGLSNPKHFETWAKPDTTTVYTLTVTDSKGKNGESDVTINIYPLPVVTFEPDDKEFCADEEEYILNGGSPEGGQYSGNSVLENIFYPSLAGVGTHEIFYTFTTEEDCKDSASYIFEVFPLPEKPNITEANKTLHTNPDKIYQWYYEDEIIPGANEQNYKPDKSGNYFVKITNENGCSNISDEYYFDITDIREFYKSDFKMSVIPNPVTSNAKINWTINSVSIVSMSLMNILGMEIINLIKQNKFESGTYSYDLNTKGLPAGIYFIKLSTINQSETIKIVIIE